MRIPLVSTLAILAIVFLFAFPKAGFYVGEVPLTFGYGLLALTGFAQLLRVIASGRSHVRADYALLGVLFFLLAVVEAATFAKCGYWSVGTLISIVASTIIVPILGLLSINFLMDALGTERFMRVMRISLGIVFAFGITSFALYNAAGVVIGVPFITTTGQDIQTVADRCNLRGTIIKMFSTYNNGNILGVNILLWGAVAAAGTRFSVMQYRSICVLTLSRSVWVGLAAWELANSITRRSLRKMAFAAAFIVALAVIVVSASWFIGRDPAAFLLDRNLGGRVTSFHDSLYGLGSSKVAWTNESLYASAFLAFGPAGAILITAIWAVPILLGGRNALEKNCRVALAVYMFVACAEAAFNLVPTQASYWMIAGIAFGAGRSRANLELGADADSNHLSTDGATSSQSRVRRVGTKRPADSPWRRSA